jgi:hypothetical protein
MSPYGQRQKPQSWIPARVYPVLRNGAGMIKIVLSFTRILIPAESGIFLLYLLASNY